MKKPGKPTLGSRMLFTLIVPGLALLALILSFPGFAKAEGDTAGDAGIQAMRSDVMACMQPGAAGQKAREAFAKKYNVPLAKVNENVPKAPPASNGAWSYDTAAWICWLEIAASGLIASVEWDSFRKADKYKGRSPLKYCIKYSMNCDHYHWTKNCLVKRDPGCCYPNPSPWPEPQPGG